MEGFQPGTRSLVICNPFTRLFGFDFQWSIKFCSQLSPYTQPIALKMSVYVLFNGVEKQGKANYWAFERLKWTCGDVAL